MGKLLKTYCAPHPPVVIPQVGQASHKLCWATYDAMTNMGNDIVALQPKRIVIISPHGTVFSDGMGILYTPTLHGDLASFGFEDIGLSFKNDMAFVDQLVQNAGKHNFVLAKIDEAFAEEMQIPYSLDHGALVPLWFVDQAIKATENKGIEVVHLAYGLLPTPLLYQFGSILKHVIKNALGDTVLIASGDLSHALENLGPYDFDPMGAVFDGVAVDAFDTGNPYKLLTFSQTKRACAKECGFRSMAIAWGAYDRLMVNSLTHSYEGPFGVGYMVASIEDAVGIRPSLVPELTAHFDALHQAKMASEDDYVKLARQVINNFVKFETSDYSDEGQFNIDKRPHGCFVSIKGETGLRGCMGTIHPTRSNLFDEIVDNAIKACSEDPRFEAISEDELDDLHISVDILMAPEKIENVSELDCKRYGLIVTSGYKKGLLLPNLEGIDTVDEQVRIAKSKAGIEDEPYRLERFEVVRHEGIVPDEE